MYLKEDQISLLLIYFSNKNLSAKFSMSLTGSSSSLPDFLCLLLLVHYYTRHPSISNSFLSSFHAVANHIHSTSNTISCVVLSFVFVAARELSLVAASGGYSLLQCVGFLLWWLLLLRSTGSRHADFSSCGSRTLEPRLSTCGIRT